MKEKDCDPELLRPLGSPDESSVLKHSIREFSCSNAHQKQLVGVINNFLNLRHLTLEASDECDDDEMFFNVKMLVPLIKLESLDICGSYSFCFDENQDDDANIKTTSSSATSQLNSVEDCLSLLTEKYNCSIWLQQNEQILDSRHNDSPNRT